VAADVRRRHAPHAPDHRATEWPGIGPLARRVFWLHGPSGKLWAFELSGDEIVAHAGPFAARLSEAVNVDDLAYDADRATLEWARQHRSEFEPSGVSTVAASTAPPLSEATLSALLADARDKTRAEAGTVFVRDGTTLRFAASYNDVLATRLGQTGAQQQLTSYGLPLNERSIASYVLLTHTPVNIADAYAIPPGAPYTFNPQWDRRNEYRTRSILALPVRDADGQVFGVLQLINPPGGFAFDDSLVRQAGLLLADWAPRLGRRR
jgi:GAF domain-containing protein